jgi:hypothetical protein
MITGIANVSNANKKAGYIKCIFYTCNWQIYKCADFILDVQISDM